MATTYGIDYTLERETEDETLHFPLSLTYGTYEAEPDVGIMTWGIEWVGATYDGLHFPLTDAEESYLLDWIRERHEP